MKKFLSLVLALVMTMSLVTISAGAKDFTDDSKVTYGEAVDVISALKVVDGYPDGSFNPTATLTRGAAAKIICNMILGPTTAGALKADVAPYKDVPVDSTFAGYIAFCAKEGIISGYADGTFKPGNSLTGYAFMKMLLGALGYDKTVEGYEGANWSINVAKRALQIGLDDGLVADFNGVKAVTREEAALYALNTLEATMVKYANDSTITVGDIVIKNNSKAEEILSGGKDYTTGGDTTDGKEATLQFCEQYFSNLKKTPVANDDMGRPAHVWYYGKNQTPDTKIDTYADAADYTEVISSTKTDRDTIAERVTKVMEKTSFDYATGLSVRINGGTTGVAGTKKNTALKVGDIVEFYMNDDGKTVETVSITRYSSAKLTNDAVTKVDGEDTLVRVPGVTGLSSYTNVKYVKGYEGLKKNDVVYYYADNAGVTHLFKAESVEGVLSSKTVGASSAPDTYTVGGTKYKMNSAAGISATAVPTNVATYGDTVTLYLDNNGYVVYSKLAEAAASTDYAVMTAIQYVKVTNASYSDNNYVEAKLVLADGTVKVVKVESVTIGAKTYKGEKTDEADYLYDKTKTGVVAIDDDTSAVAGLVNSCFVSYKVNSDGKYELTKIAKIGDTNVTHNAALDNPTTITNKAAKLDQGSGADYAVNDNTVFIIATKSGQETFKAYTGKSAAPTVTATASIALVHNGYAKYVFVSAYTGSAVFDGDKVIILDASAKDNITERIDGTNVHYYTYLAVKDGEIGKIKAGTGAASNVSTIGNYAPSYDANGIITGLSTVTACDGVADGDAWAFDGTTFVANGIGFNCDADAPVYFLSTADGAEFEAMTAADFAGENDKNDTVYVEVKADGSVEYVIIIEVDDDETGISDLKVGTTKITLTSGAATVASVAAQNITFDLKDRCATVTVKLDGVAGVVSVSGDTVTYNPTGNGVAVFTITAVDGTTQTISLTLSGVTP